MRLTILFFWIRSFCYSMILSLRETWFLRKLMSISFCFDSFSIFLYL